MKVLPFHIFDRTNVVALDTEPVHMCALTEDTFVSSHATGVVALHRVAAAADATGAPLAVSAPTAAPAAAAEEGAARDAAAATPLLAWFRPVARVVLALLAVAQPQRAVVTIEPETARAAHNVVRVYTLPADIDDLAPTSAPPPPASSAQEDDGGGSSGVGTPVWCAGGAEGRMPLYELPLRASAMCAAVCPVTGRLAVATRDAVSVWAPVRAAGADGALAYERMCQLACAGVRHVALHDAYLACATARAVCVLECVLQRAADAAAATAAVAAQHSAHPDALGGGGGARAECTAPVDDESLVRVVAVRGRLCARPSIAALGSSSSSSSGSSDGAAFSVGPFSEMAQSVAVEPQFVVRSLQIFFRAQYDRSEGDVHTLALLPEYSHIAAEEGDGGSGSDDDDDGKLEMIGMRCFASTRLQGRLYNARERSVLATYRYTYLTVQCCVTSTLLYALRAAPDAGLEAFTLRSSMNTAEYSAPAPCLLGTQPFLGPQCACVMGQHILLLTKLTDPSLPDPEPVSPFNPPHLRKPTPQQPPQQQPQQGGRTRGRRAAPVVSGVAWNVYLLHPTDAAQLNDEIVAYATTTVANQAEELNESVYYLLVLEAHFLVQDAIVAMRRRLAAHAGAHDAARTLSARLELRRLHGLLRGSASRLGDFYFFHAHQYHKAAQCYSESNRTLVDVSRIFLQQEDGRAALLEYYDRVLFDPAMLPFMAEDPDLSNEILRYYVEFAPHRLSTVIIDSCLSAYSQPLALVLLDLAQQVRTMTAECRRTNLQAVALTSDSASSASPARPADPARDADIPPKDLFAKALLTLDLGENDTALAVLRAMRGDPVVDFCTAKPSLLECCNSEGEGNNDDNNDDECAALERALRDTAPAGNRLVAALRVAAPLSLLEIATRLGPRIVSPAVLHLAADSPMLPAGADAAALADENAFLLMCYLESRLEAPPQLLQRGRHEAPVAAHAPGPVAVLAARLAELYLAKIAAGAQAPLAHSEIARRVAESRRGDGLFCRWLAAHQAAFSTRRLAWMDLIPPFADDALEGCAAATAVQDQPQQQPQCEAVSPRPAARNPFHDSALEAHDYTHFYTRKLESLLCSGLLGDTTRLVALLDDAIAAAGDDDGTQQQQQQQQRRRVLETLRALLQPLAGACARADALGALLERFPLLAEELGAMYCAGADDWAVVVARLVAILRAAAPGTPQHARVEATYEAVLARIATALTPQQFLAVLPDDGNILFFLRFIERSCEKQLGTALCSSIIRAMQDAEREQAVHAAQ